jgi:hypothetical protein
MSHDEPFRSRPRIDRESPEQEPSPVEPDNESYEEDIIEGIMEESLPQAIVPAEQVRQPLKLPDDQSVTDRVTRPGLLLIALGLTIGGIFLTIVNNADLPTAIEEWWPAVSLVAAMLWSVGALLRRDVRSFLGGVVVAGISVSLLLETQGIASFGETVVGIILMTFGLAIVMRGLLLRSVQTVR